MTARLGPEVRSFQDLVVWQKAIHLTVEIYRLTEQFPSAERFGVTSQLRRAASSVAANIAEGHARSTRRDYASFVSIARGSLAEARTYLELSVRLGYASKDLIAPLEELAEEVSKMLVALRSRLMQDDRSTRAFDT